MQRGAPIYWSLPDGQVRHWSQGGKWLDEIPLSEVMLANVKLKKTDGRIWAASMKGLARCSAELCAGTQLVLSFDAQTQKLIITDGHCQPCEGE